MNKEYITVKMPILDEVDEMKVAKTFNEEQLWYVCALARAFEKQRQALLDIKEYIEKNKKQLPVGRDPFACEMKYSGSVVSTNEVLDIVNNALGSDSNE